METEVECERERGRLQTEGESKGEMRMDIKEGEIP